MDLPAFSRGILFWRNRCASSLRGMFFSESMSGTFYAVSTGPAGADFITLGAVRVLGRCPTIFYPVTGSGEGKHIAFDCVCEAVDVSGKECVGVRFSMSGDKARTDAEYGAFASRAAEYLEKGDVAFVSIGDVSIYSTAARIAKIVGQMGFRVEFVAGVPSFCAAACSCALDMAPGLGDEIRIIPGDACYRSGALGDVLSSPGTKIFMKSPRHLGEIVSEVVSRGLSGSAHLVQGAGGADERIVTGDVLAEAGADVFGNAYMSVLVVGV